MDLGNKTLNNLTSKNANEAKTAAKALLDSKDTDAFGILSEKSEFIFDFIKEKILNNLLNAVNQNNVMNLFEFTNVYSDDFKQFIVEPLIKFNNEEISNKMFELLTKGSLEQKFYAVEFFTYIKNQDVVNYVREYLKSDFEPLKTSSIRLLAEYKINEEYNEAINILNTETDTLTLFEACEFLCMYGNKTAFEPVYNYFVKSEYSEIIASNLLFLKGFDELIKEDKEKEVLNIYASILKAFPETTQLSEITYYLSGRLFEYLIESPDNLSALLNFVLKSKFELLLNDDSYSIDLTNNEKSEARVFVEKLGILLDGFNFEEILSNALKSDNYFENYFALNYIIEDKIGLTQDIKDLTRKTANNEIKIMGIRALKGLNRLQNDFLKEIEATITNENIKAEIETYSA